jgi:hypothetical protein
MPTGPHLVPPPSHTPAGPTLPKQVARTPKRAKVGVSFVFA